MGFFPGIRDRDFLFWARPKNPEITEEIPNEKSRVKNSENPEILGIGICKPRKNPEKIPSEKSRNPGDRDLDLKIPKKLEKNLCFTGFLSVGIFARESDFF